jgi:cell division protein FtsQ
MAFAANVDRALLLRRRALKKAEGRRRLVLLCLAVAAVIAPIGYWVLANSSAFAVSGVSVSGGGSLVSAEVRQAAVGAIGRKSLLQVDASAVARAVEKLPYVRTASVDRSFPHTLSIRITTYRPAAAVRSGKAAYLVSSDGRCCRRTWRRTRRCR